jgi:hypothetical protein
MPYSPYCSYPKPLKGAVWFSITARTLAQSSQPGYGRRLRVPPVARTGKPALDIYLTYVTDNSDDHIIKKL